MDIRLYYTDNGEGEPLILLHGNGESGAYFHNQIEYFSQTRRVIAIDTRGHGGSPKGTEPFTLSTFVDDLHGFMWRHDIPRADILGFSDGGNIALMFAMKYPSNVNRLILNGANLRFSGLTVKTAAEILGGYIKYCITAPFSKYAAQKKALYRLMVAEPRIRAEELRFITAPTLVIVGDHDMIRAAHSRRIAGSIPNCKMVTISGDHFIAAKNPDAFNKAVEDFLNRGR